VPSADDHAVGPLAALVLLATLAVFWPATLVGAALQPGYRASRDVISALASYGARSAWIGVTAIAVLALGHGALGLGIGRALRAVLASVLVVGSSVAGLATALFRIHCPGGAAGCRNTFGTETVRPFTDAAHGKAVAAYAALLALGMVAFGVHLARRRIRAGRWLAAASVAFGVASAVLAAGLRHASYPGAQQRTWLAVNSLWGVGVAALLLVRRARR
jgi:uncharacterized protein DUF998